MLPQVNQLPFVGGTQCLIYASTPHGPCNIKLVDTTYNSHVQVPSANPLIVVSYMYSFRDLIAFPFSGKPINLHQTFYALR